MGPQLSLRSQSLQRPDDLGRRMQPVRPSNAVGSRPGNPLGCDAGRCRVQRRAHLGLVGTPLQRGRVHRQVSREIPPLPGSNPHIRCPERRPRRLSTRSPWPWEALGTTSAATTGYTGSTSNPRAQLSRGPGADHQSADNRLVSAVADGRLSAQWSSARNSCQDCARGCRL